jgi:transposase
MAAPFGGEAASKERVEKAGPVLVAMSGHGHTTTHPSDLTDEQWAQVERFIPAPKPGGRPAKYPRREIVNAPLYLNRTGYQWRALPHDFPPWARVYWYFRIWKTEGTPDRLHDELRRSSTADRSRRPKTGAEGLRLR